MFKQDNVQIDLQGSLVTTQVVVGHAQHGDFEQHLFDTEGNNPQKIGGGSTVQSAPPPQAINVNPAQLENRFILTRTIVQNLAGASAAFSVTTVYRQGGKECGRIETPGNFDASNTEVVTHVARFVRQ